MIVKRIVDGVTYNTATSTLLAQSEYETDYNHETYHCIGKLYQTRGNAFFVHEVVNLGYDDEGDEVTRDKCNPLSSAQAQQWLMTGDVEVFHNPFDEPPEAVAEEEPASTIYIRVPQSLKKQVDDAARAGQISGNAWAMRCIERCLSPSRPEKSAAELDDLVRTFVEKEYQGSITGSQHIKIVPSKPGASWRIAHSGSGALSAALDKAEEVLTRRYDLLDVMS